MYSWEWLGGNIEIHELKLVNFVSSSPVLSAGWLGEAGGFTEG